MRNSNTTLFKKGVRVTEEHYNYIKNIKIKKSIAGKLKEIIDIYKEKYEM